MSPPTHAPDLKDYILVSANGRLGQESCSQVNDVARILDIAMSQEPKSGLVMHFHGGLVDQAYATTDIAARLSSIYRDEADG